jgi:hypothetical protein
MVTVQQIWVPVQHCVPQQVDPTAHVAPTFEQGHPSWHVPPAQ